MAHESESFALRQSLGDHLRATSPTTR